MAKLVSPSLLSADFTNLEKEVKMLNNSEADWIHLDIMDGVFVPNITFGFPVIKQIKKIAQKPLDVHLMIEKPERYIKDFKEAGANILVVHAEACTHLHRTIQEIKSYEMMAGVALNPHTSLTAVEEVLTEVDMVLLMSVNPGFGGQSFISSVLDKVKRLKQEIEKRQANTIIQIDGGVDTSNASTITTAGVDCLVAGSAVFGADVPEKVIADLKKA